jgi:hypothetical protein
MLILESILYLKAHSKCHCERRYAPRNDFVGLPRRGGTATLEKVPAGPRLAMTGLIEGHLLKSVLQPDSLDRRAGRGTKYGRGGAA